MRVGLFEVSFALAVFTLILPLVILFWKFARQPFEIKWLAILLSFSFVCDITSIILVAVHSNPNYSATVYWLFSTALLSTFFLKIIGSKKLSGFFIWINIFYFLLAIINLLFIQGIQINTYSVIIQSIIVLALSILYFYKLLRELPTQQLQKLPWFWIVSGFFFTYAGKLVVYTVTYYLINFEQDTNQIIWSFHNFLTIIANLLIGYGAWLNHKQLRSTSLSLSRS
jgi:hypothetical protein